jgi:hypothetical protein
MTSSKRGVQSGDDPRQTRKAQLRVLASTAKPKTEVVSERQPGYPTRPIGFFLLPLRRHGRPVEEISTSDEKEGGYS